jgi:hypothetical protein
MTEAKFSIAPRCTCPVVAWGDAMEHSVRGVVGKVAAWRSKSYQMEMVQSIRLDEEISCEFGAASVLLVHAQRHHLQPHLPGVTTRLG